MRFLHRAWRWFDARIGFSSAILPIIEHPVPRVDWWYVLGSATLVAFTVQVVTGVALAFTYVPAPNSAYDSLAFITHAAALGNVVRGIHYWGSTAMVLLVVAHMAHVFLIGAFKYPRELNWLTGVMLLLMTLGLAFTGQLLRWNQDAYWAVVVTASQAARAPVIGEWLAQVIVAGQTVGGATLTRFYATHVFLLPAVIFLVVGVHLYLVIRHGVSEVPQPGRPVDPATYQREYDELIHREGVPFWPDFAWKDVVFALAVGSLVLLLAIVVGAPELGKPADPTNVEAYPRPDWYFLWYFALLAILPYGLEDWFIVGFPLLVGGLLLALPFIAPTGERSPRRRPWAIGVVGLTGISIAVLVWLGYRAPWSPVYGARLPAQAVPASLPPSAQRGAVLFDQKGCLGCHSLAGVGGERGPSLRNVGDRLTRDQIISRILNGGNGMPAYGTALTPEETAALVDFLQAQRRGAP